MPVREQRVERAVAAVQGGPVPAAWAVGLELRPSGDHAVGVRGDAGQLPDVVGPLLEVPAALRRGRRRGRDGVRGGDAPVDTAKGFVQETIAHGYRPGGEWFSAFN